MRRGAETGKGASGRGFPPQPGYACRRRCRRLSDAGSIPAQSKSLDAVTGPSAGRLETISYAGRIGRLYNLLRRSTAENPNPTIDAETVKTICQLNNIDRSSREKGLDVLRRSGRIDVARNEAVSVLGATSKGVLETTADIFTAANPTREENAVLALSEEVAERPITRPDAVEMISDTYRIPSRDAKSLIRVCKDTALIDEEVAVDRVILFNSNTFRDGQYAAKAHTVLEGLTATERQALSEVQELLALQGALYENDVRKILGNTLYRRLVSVGLFDRMEVSNPDEAVGYISSPNDFQKYGRPFEDDPIDDAKALLASLTYGRTRSHPYRGRITLPDALLRALISGREVGGESGVRAIGEDYKELERRQVVQVTPRPHNRSRFTFHLLKRDVAELALTIVRGEAPAKEAVLLDGAPATGFKGPHQSRIALRNRNTIGDREFVANAIDRLRTGG